MVFVDHQRDLCFERTIVEKALFPANNRPREAISALLPQVVDGLRATWVAVLRIILACILISNQRANTIPRVVLLEGGGILRIAQNPRFVFRLTVGRKRILC